MKKAFFTTVLLLLAAIQLKAQIVVSGTVTESESGNPLEGATITVDNSLNGTFTGKNGEFRFQNLKPGLHVFSLSFIGFEEFRDTLLINSDTTLNIALKKTFYHTDEIVITATRADNKSAMAYSTIDKSEIEQINTGRDLPYLLESVPSLVATSDAGTGIGYTGVRIRGSDASRINVTINGIPINDSESQLLYWVNMPDLATSVENIQVQRGVGTSTNGASAFGGSINIRTGATNEKPYLNTTASYGSFNTFKSNAEIGTGLINNKWNFEGRLSKITSDGYIDRATSDLKSFFISGGYYGKKDQVRLNIFSGKEITYQSWYGVPEASLDTNRTWNYYTYDNQVDNYQQDHYQLFYTHEFNSNFLFNTGLHFTYGRGYYEEYKEQEYFADYHLDDVIIGNDTITQTNLIRRKWLDNNFYGLIWSFIYKPKQGLNFILGGGYNEYDGDHFGEVIWSQYASSSQIRQRYYEDNGFKTDFNVYVKGTVDINEKLSVFGDAQLRNIDYTFNGPDNSGVLLEQNITHQFFNPKAGITYTVAPGRYGYFSFGIANKEPSRDDYTESTSNSRPESERLYDFECGYYHRAGKFMAGFNYFMMLYDNQLVLTGEVNDVGNYTRRNIKKSSREGVELEAEWKPLSYLKLNGNATFSKNKINEYREYIDDYDNGGQQLNIYKNTDLAFSPDITGYLSITGLVAKRLQLSLINRYIGSQYLDNTSSSDKKINAYFINDFRINYSLNPRFMKEIMITFAVNNLLDVKYESNGYTFSYIYGGERVHENYYYPQAGINTAIQVTLKF